MSNNKYSGENILVLDDIDAIRKNPGMYIGEINNPNHLFYEVINNSIDEHIMGHGNFIDIKFIDNNIVEIRDFGRGIPFDSFNDEFLACEIVFIKNHSGGKFKSDIYQHSGGLHGVGLVAVNALSEFLDVTIFRNDKMHIMHFKYGRIISSITLLNINNTPNGTLIKFKADSNIFKQIEFDFNTILERLDYITALNTNLKINIFNNYLNQTYDVCNPNGIISLMNKITKNNINDNHIYYSYNGEDYKYSIIINWSQDHASEKFMAFTNSIIQPDGGSHVYGIRLGILNFFNKNKIFNHILNNRDLSYSDIKHGIVFIINLSMQSPSFSSQEKVKLVSNDIKNHIAEHLSLFLTNMYLENKLFLNNIIKKINKLLISKYQKNNEIQLSAMMLKGALFDCYTKNREEAELFITEGESASGIVKPVMDRKTQAILGIRGKILNVEKASLGQMLESEKLYSIIKSIGGRIEQDNKVVLDDLRYGSIIILADADSDGDHIRALLLTFFHKYMPSIIEEGRLFVGVPPLFKLQLLNNSCYFTTEDDLIDFFIKNLNNYTNCNLNFNEEIYMFLKYMVNTMYNKKWDIEFNNYIAFILDIIINYNIKDFNQLIDIIDVMSSKLKSLYSTIEVFLNNKNEIIIENYINLQKQVINIDIVNILIENISNINVESITNLSNLLNIEKDQIIQFLYKYILHIKNKLIIQRFKGLGEMNKDQIFETVINKKNRILKKISIHDVNYAYQLRDTLMGNNIDNRKKFIVEFLENNSDDLIAEL
ncbi:DNA gyrase subunit B [uncultured bacterium]|nr:DNA gyrase subunit B [uncultured bacterium]